MFGSYQTIVEVSIEGTVLSEMSKVVALNAEGLSAMFHWGFLEGCKEGENVELVEGMYSASLYRDFYGFDLLIGFKI